MQNSQMQELNTQIQELTLEEMQQVGGAECYVEYVWKQPQVICTCGPWDDWTCGGVKM